MRSVDYQIYHGLKTMTLNELTMAIIPKVGYVSWAMVYDRIWLHAEVRGSRNVGLEISRQIKLER